MSTPRSLLRPDYYAWEIPLILRDWGAENKIKAEYPTALDIPGAEAVVTAMESKHPVLSGLWYKGLGLDLQHMDSQICDRVLTELTGAEIPCLSVYDSFIVPQRFDDRLRKAMVRAFREITGATYDPPID